MLKQLEHSRRGLPENLGNLHNIRDVNVGQNVHQLLKISNIFVAEFSVFELPVGSFVVLQCHLSKYKYVKCKM